MEQKWIHLNAATCSDELFRSMCADFLDLLFLPNNTSYPLLRLCETLCLTCVGMPTIAAARKWHGYIVHTREQQSLRRTLRRRIDLVSHCCCYRPATLRDIESKYNDTKTTMHLMANAFRINQTRASGLQRPFSRK
jgi:hypothetical protein